MSDPTPEQQAALNVLGASVALMSGAGCGKTRVLTDRYVKALDSPGRLALPSILALTFTEKAARELRDRVRKACRDRQVAEADSPHWRSVRRGLEAAPISTFHGFCADVLRAFPIEAGVEPGFRVLDESLAGVMRRQSLVDALRWRLIEGEPSLRGLALRLGLSGMREVVADLVARRAGRDYAAWRDISTEQIAAFWRQAFEETAEETARATLGRLAARPLAKLRPEDCGNPVLRSTLLEIREGFRALESGASTDLTALRDLCEAKENLRSADWPSTKVKDGVRTARKKLLELIDKTTSATRWDEALAERMAVETRALCLLTCDVLEAYGARKRQAGALDFDDLQASVLGLLRGGPAETVERIRQSIELILVDEFQDTDPVQAEILERLAGEGMAGGRLFLVGDLRQSIYAFRGAAPKLLDVFRDRFPLEGRLQLSQNFRSIPWLVRFVNALFSRVFTRPEDRLRASRSQREAPNRAAVTFVSPTADDGPRRTHAALRRRTEAEALAGLLRTRLDAGWIIHDPISGEPRRAGPGDVVFLLRSHAQAAPLERGLLDAGFDYYVVGGGAFHSQPEVLDLINLLTVLEDPTDEVALAGLLRSPMLGLSDEALYWLSRSSVGTLADGLTRRDDLSELPHADRPRVERAGELLERWRGLKDKVSIGDLLERALDESGYEAALLAERHGARMRANCRKLVRVARTFDAYGGFGLADFVERLRADYEDPPREAQEATTDEMGEAVRIMTIHQAKGLEFPIVFLPNLDRDRPARAERVTYLPEFGAILHGTEAEVGGDEEVDALVNPIDWLVRNRRANLEREEELRVFYVAVTRAREGLVLSSTQPPDVRGDSASLALLAEQFDLATGRYRGAETGEVERDCPGIEVVQAGDFRAVDSPRRSRRGGDRSRLLLIAREIEHAAEGMTVSVESEPGPVSFPAWIDLDAGPVDAPAELALRRLVRTACVDSRLYSDRRPPLCSLVSETGRRLVPGATRRVENEAVRLLELWDASARRMDLGEHRTGLEWEITLATRGFFASSPISRGSRPAGTSEEGPGLVEPHRRLLENSSVAPRNGNDSCEFVTFRGRTELAFRDEQGWHLVHVAPACGDKVVSVSDRIRAALAVSAVGLAPIVSSRLVLLGAEGVDELNWARVPDGVQLADEVARLVQALDKAGKRGDEAT